MYHCLWVESVATNLPNIGTLITHFHRAKNIINAQFLDGSCVGPSNLVRCNSSIESTHPWLVSKLQVTCIGVRRWFSLLSTPVSSTSYNWPVKT